MWYITHVKTGEKIHIEKAKTTVGRKGTDISLTGDDSISRNHAVLAITPSGLTIQDTGSKYGTFIICGNKTQKVETKPIKLTKDAHIRFGKLGNDWNVHKIAKPLEEKPAKRPADSIEESSSHFSSELPSSFDLPATNLSSGTSNASLVLPASSFCSELPATIFTSELPTTNSEQPASSFSSNQATSNWSSEEPVPKKRKVIQILDDSDDEPPPKPRPSRKRPASEVDGGLFSFNTNFVKKAKSKETQKESQEVRGIVPLSKPREPSPVKSRKSSDGYLCDISDCVWLSKKMLSTNLLDNDDGIKSEFVITSIKIKKEPTMDSEDVKPSQLDTLFSVLEPTLTASTTTSLVSKRKQFVKKRNYKPQNKVVTTKTVKVEDTFIPLDEF